jgi:hypothetical protein
MVDGREMLKYTSKKYIVMMRSGLRWHTSGTKLTFIVVVMFGYYFPTIRP